MRRTVVLAIGLTLALAGVAVAAVSYKTGTYKAGSATGQGVSLKIKHGSFSLSRISFKETCTSSVDQFSEPFTFIKGSRAKLDGKIDSKSRLSGSYKSDAGTVKITGTVKGSAATVKGSEHGTFTPSTSTRQYDCRGSHTFHAKLVK
jgi:hypothetical protein